MKKKFEGQDTFEKSFSDYGEFTAFLKGKEDETLWLTVPIKDCTVNEFTVGGLIPTEDIVKKLGVTASEDAIYSVADHENPELSHICVRARTTSGLHYSWLFSQSGYKDLVNRYGASCPLFFKLNKLEQVDFLNLAPKTIGEKVMKVQFLDEKIWSCHGPNYRVLEPSKLVQSVKNNIDSIGEVRFSYGYYSHELVDCMFQIENQGLVQAYTDMLFERTGNLNYLSFYGAIRFVTSDVGDSSASVTPYITDGRMSINIGNPIKMRHAGNKSSISDWEDEMKRIYANFEQSIDALNKLMDIPVRYPITCAMNIARDLDISIDSMVTATEAYEGAFDGGGTASDVFMFLQEGLFLMEQKAKKKAIRSETVEAKKEELTALLKKSFKWSEYDVNVVFQNKKRKGKRVFRANT